MQLETDQYYHIYNRSNNHELVFKKQDNYLYFLRKFRSRFKNSLTIFAYCLMPTHFHFLIRVDTEDTDKLKQDIGIHLSSYTKAVNKAFNRNGSLFQAHTKSILIDERSYLLTLLTYIHQNPIRAGIVDDLTSWPYSSYCDLSGYRNGSLVDKALIKQNFESAKDFIKFSNRTITSIDKSYWVRE